MLLWLLMSFVTIGVVNAQDECHTYVESTCSLSTPGKDSCNARYGGINNIEPEIQAYINSQLTKSYEYLLMATNFNSYQRNRPGFEKLYRSLSDRSFDATIVLIKQLARRGGKVDFNTRHDSPASVSKQQLKMELDELHSLAVALDNEKQLANGAIHVHTRATHTSERDPEVAHFFEEKFLGDQAETVRQLAGYVNDLSRLMYQDDPSLAVYLFDEDLLKQ